MESKTNELGQTFSEAVEAVETTDVLATITATNLIDISSWKEKQEKLVRDNAFVEIIDNKTYEAGKIKRTNVVKGRTGLENQDKLVASKFAAIRKEVGTETASLIAISKPLEDKWQEAVKKWEDRKAKEKEEAAAAEKLRIKTIKEKIDAFETSGYELIQKLTFSEIESKTDEMSKLEDTDFDYEEYDVLLDQVRDRLTETLKLKISSLTVSENQRLDNERLENEAKETKRLSDLQAARLTEILPYVAFGDAVDLTKLSEMDDNEYQSVLSAKKVLSETDSKQKQEAEKIAAAKLEEEKDAVYEIRKKRLEELGMIYSLEHDTFWLDENEDYILLASDVSDWSAVEFEDTFSEVKCIIQAAKDKVEKQKTLEIRVDRLIELGLEYVGDTFTIDHVKTGVTSTYELLGLDVSNADDAKFETIIAAAKLTIEKAKLKVETDKNRALLFEEAGMFLGEGFESFKIGRGDGTSFTVTNAQVFDSSQDAFNDLLEEAKKEYAAYKLSIEQDAKLAKENEAKSKAENKARIKKYAGDKKLLTEFVESLNFHNSVPEMENPELQIFLDELIIAIDGTKKDLLITIEQV